MTELVPFRSGDFLGTLEVQGKFETISKQLRLQRLKEVRQQERLIAQKRCTTYRQCINIRKTQKANVIRGKKKEEMENDLENLNKKWHCANEETGSAHRLAKSTSENTMENSVEETKLALRRMEIEKKRGLAAQKFRHDEILKAQSESLRLLSLMQVKKDIRQSEREDAHAIGETIAARQQLLNIQRTALDNMHSVPAVYTQKRVLQGAISIEQRFPVEVRARVVRHGKHPRDQSIIRNEAVVEEVMILRKNWQLVMREMTTRNRTRVRAKVAEQVVERHKGVKFLDSELHQLEVADKAPGRQFRLNSAQAVAPDIEGPRLQGTFERIFLSKPVRLETHDVVYRTGSQLVQAALDEHTQSLKSIAEEELPPQQQHPHWAVPVHAFVAPPPPGTFARNPLITFEDMEEHRKEVRDDSSSTSSILSGEVKVIYRQRMYDHLPQDETIQDIPSISRPPPHFVKTPTGRDDNFFDDSVKESSPLTFPTTGTFSSHQGLQVRVPQVSTSKKSQSSNESHPIEIISKSAILHMDMRSEKDSNDDQDVLQDAPLSIQIRGMDSPSALRMQGSVTPPRQSSSRVGMAGTPLIDPFTPPEAHAPRPNVNLSPGLLNRRTERLDSPQSSASSNKTEQARHDRTSPQSNKILDESSNAIEVSVDKMSVSTDSNNYSNASFGNGSSNSSLSGRFDREVVLDSVSQEIRELDASLESSYFTEPVKSNHSSALPVSHRLVRTHESSHSSSSEMEMSRSFAEDVSSILSILEEGPLESSRSNSIGSANSTNVSDKAASNAELELLISSAQSSKRSMHPETHHRRSHSSSAPSTRSSSSSSSSSSMLSYLQSSPFPTRPDARFQRETNASGGGFQSAFSPARSVTSDNISVLSTNSEEIRYAASSRTDSNAASTFSLLTRQQVHEVLEEISEVDSKADSEIGQAQNYALHQPQYQPDKERESAVGRSEDFHNSSLIFSSMYDSWDADQFLTVRVGAPVVAPTNQADFPLTSNEAEESPERSMGVNLGVNLTSAHASADLEHRDDLSHCSENTEELFDKWQALVRGTEQLGDQAREMRSKHLNSYTLNTSTVVRTEDTSFMSQTSPNSSPREAANMAPSSAAMQNMATLTTSPLNVFAFPSVRDSHVSLLGSHGLGNNRPYSDSVNSLSSDSLSLQHSESLRHTEVRESYDYSHADSVISALDKLSTGWSRRYESSVELTPPRAHTGRTVPMPSGPTIYQSPFTLKHGGHTGDAPAALLPHSTASVSSLSGAVSPPEDSGDARGIPDAQSKSTYSGRLVVHREQRQSLVSHSVHMATSLGMDDSLLDSSSSSTGYKGPEDPRALISSEEEDDPSLEELLREPFQDDLTMGALKGEFSSLMERMRQSGSVPLLNSSFGKTQSPPDRSLKKNHSRDLTSNARHPHPTAQSSGEETNSSGKYFSAESTGEGRNTSGSTMLTAATSSPGAEPTFSRIEQSDSRASLPYGIQQYHKRATSSLTIHTASRKVTPSNTTITEAESSLREGTRSKLEMEAKSPDNESSLSAPVVNLDTTQLTPSSDRYSSPSASRLSEYAMLSQHTLTPSTTYTNYSVHRKRSPGDEFNAGNIASPTRFSYHSKK